MRDDQPTLPNLGRFAPDPFHEPNAVGDLQDLNQTPIWPGADERARAAHASHPAPHGYVSATLFGISLIANVALVIGLLGVLFLSHAGFFSPNGSSGQSSSGVSGSGNALGSPTPTSMASPTPNSGWLRVAPNSITLGCGDGQRSQVVILENTGPNRVKWQVSFSGSSGQAGVSVSPQEGRLAPGATTSLQIQNTTSASDGQNVSGQQGVINFTTTSSDIGPPATLSYTTMGC